MCVMTTMLTMKFTHALTRVCAFLVNNLTNKLTRECYCGLKVLIKVLRTEVVVARVLIEHEHYPCRTCEEVLMRIQSARLVRQIKILVLGG